jgi:hypothetical protein
MQVGILYNNTDIDGVQAGSGGTSKTWEECKASCTKNTHCNAFVFDNRSNCPESECCWHKGLPLKPVYSVGRLAMLVRLPPATSGWHGPIYGTYSDAQCPNVGCHSWKGANQSAVMTNLEALCDGEKGCTAFNVGGGGGCLRACLPDRLIRYNISGGGCCSYFRIGPPKQILKSDDAHARHSSGVLVEFWGSVTVELVVQGPIVTDRDIVFCTGMDIDRAAPGHKLKTDDTQSYDETLQGPPLRFHIGAAAGPGLDARNWANWSQANSNGLPAAMPEMWARYSDALELYARANFTIFDGGPPLPASGPGQQGPCDVNVPIPCHNNKTEPELQIQATFLKLCAAAGLEVMNSFYWDGGKVTEAERKVVWGYSVADEPGPNLYASLANQSAHVRALRPESKVFINLAPLYSCSQTNGAWQPTAWPVQPEPAVHDCVEQYTAYVDQFVKQVLPSMPRGSPLCFDHYPSFDLPDDPMEDNYTKPNAGSSRAGYRTNLAIVRAAALRADVPFWNYFITMSLGGPDQSEAQLAWQMFTSLAYGAKGLLWFCYMTPACQGTSFNRGGSPLSPQGPAGQFHNCSVGCGVGCDPLPPSDIWQKPTEKYKHAGRLNGIVRIMGDFLLHAHSVNVYRALPEPAAADPTGIHHLELQPSTNLRDGVSAIAAVQDVGGFGLRISHRLAGEGVLLGQFELPDGRTAVLIANHNFDWTLWPTLVAAPHYNFSAAMEVRGDGDGGETPLLDDSPMMEGMQMSLQPGMARLIVMHRANATRENATSIDAKDVGPGAAQVEHTSPNVTVHLQLPGNVEAAAVLAAVVCNGTLLHNGICSDLKRPRTLDYLVNGTFVPDYLRHPPPVINVSIGRQLFVDSFLIEASAGIRLMPHVPVWEEAETSLLGSTELWEQMPLGPRLSGATWPSMVPDEVVHAGARPFSGGLWWDEENFLYRLWYLCPMANATEGEDNGWHRFHRFSNEHGGTCYAESADGRSWHKPALEVVPGTNVVIPEVTEGLTVWRCPDGGGARWLAAGVSQTPTKFPIAGTNRTFSSSAFTFYDSFDGIHWVKRVNASGPILDRSTVWYDAFRSRWVASIKDSFGPSHGGMMRRARSWWAADSLIEGNGSQWKNHGSNCDRPECPWPWLTADINDAPNPSDKTFPAELYNVDGANYESVNLLLLAIFRGDQGTNSELNELHLGWSRDGYQVHRPLPHAAFMAGTWPAPSWHRTNIQSVGGGLILAGDDTLRIYATGRGAPRPGYSVNTADGVWRGNWSMGYASLRRDQGSR